LKANHAPSWAQWESLLKTKVQLSTGRASELMQLADGRKSLQEIRDSTAQRVADLRARSSSLQSQCNEEDPVDEIPEQSERTGGAEQEEADNEQEEPTDAKQEEAGKKRAAVVKALLKAGAKEDDLIEALARSTHETRAFATEALIKGRHQTKFDAVRSAVSDLYQRLMGAGK